MYAHSYSETGPLRADVPRHLEYIGYRRKLMRRLTTRSNDMANTNKSSSRNSKGSDRKDSPSAADGKSGAKSGSSNRKSQGGEKKTTGSKSSR